jgi:hypothetical protein
MCTPDEMIEDVEAKLDKLTPWEIEEIARKRVTALKEEAEKYLNQTTYTYMRYKTNELIQTEILLELRKGRKLLEAILEKLK